MKFLPLVLFCFASSFASAEIVTNTVAYEHDGVKLEGFLAYDDTPGSAKRPGVLVIHEWWGLGDYVKARAQQLAEMGYVAFAADMFGTGKSTTDAAQAKEWATPFFGKPPLMAERAKAGLDQLIKSGLADEKKLASIGFCFGGTASQALALSGAPLAGIVSFHGPPLPPPAEAKGKVKARFLILNGAADPMVKAEDINAFIKAMEAAVIDYQFINYSGALHAFSNPGATALAEKNKLSNAVGYQAAAATRSWAHTELFFEELFR